MKNKDVKKMHKIRNAVMMVLLCVLMLSTGTFAWFTMGNNANVNKLSMKVANSTGGLFLGRNATYVEADYSALLDLNQYANATYFPATTDKRQNDEGFFNMYRPTEYNILTTVTGGATHEVSAVELTTGSPLNEDADNPYYYYTDSFYVYKTGSDEELNKLQISADSLRSLFTPAEGKDIKDSIKSLRIAFIYGPDNSRTTKVFKFETTDLNSGLYATTNKTLAESYGEPDGVIEIANDANDHTLYDLGTITSKTVTPIKVQIWFEGTDDSCRNSIQSGELAGNLVLSLGN